MLNSINILIALLVAACLSISYAVADAIIVQSTTSTANSGLYSYILPKFKAETGISVSVVAVGTGQAIRNAEKGDADVLLVHERNAEQEFVEEGFGVRRHDLMYNDFILVGPPEDPAGVHNYENISEALSAIALEEKIFVSRGDHSGTHIKEMTLWKNANIDPLIHSGRWYRETGSGMGTTLNVALGMRGYTITDRATWISFKNKTDFLVLLEGSPELFNQYGIILVNPERHPHVNSKEGQKFIDWMISKNGQRAIAEYKRDGQQLFFPNASMIENDSN